MILSHQTIPKYLDYDFSAAARKMRTCHKSSESLILWRPLTTLQNSSSLTREMCRIIITAVDNIQPLCYNERISKTVNQITSCIPLSRVRGCFTSQSIDGHETLCSQQGYGICMWAAIGSALCTKVVETGDKIGHRKRDVYCKYFWTSFVLAAKLSPKFVALRRSCLLFVYYGICFVPALV